MPRQLLSFVAVIALLLVAGPVSSQTTTPDLLLSARGSHSIQRYDGETGAYLGDFVEPQSGGLLRPQDIVYGPDGNIYVSGFATPQVLRFHPETGAFIGPFTTGRNLAQPTKFAFHTDGLLYISQWAGDEKVLRFDGTTGVFVDEFTSQGVPSGCGFVWDADGNFIIANWGSNGNGTDGNVLRFDPEGEFMDVLIPTGRGGLLGPVHLWLEGSELFVQDWTAGKVIKYDVATGDFISTFVTGLVRTEGFEFDADGVLYLADWAANRVNRYDSEGSFLDTFASGSRMGNPNALRFMRRSAPTATDSEEHPSNVSLEVGYPNPFATSTTVEFGLARAGAYEIAVFNILGKRVRTFSTHAAAAGRHQVEWDGASDSGTLVSPGIYLMRLTSGSASVTTRVIKSR